MTDPLLCCEVETAGPTEVSLTHPTEESVIGVYFKCNWCESRSQIVWGADLDRTRILAQENWDKRIQEKADV